MYDYSCFSLCGDNEHNEDKIEIFAGNGFQGFILADGLGGHGKGEVASAAAVDYVKSFLLNAVYIDRNIIRQSILGAQDHLRQLKKNNYGNRGMKTTIVVLVLTEKVAYCGHVGDSRMYAFKHGKIIFQTKDHSVPQMMVDLGKLSAKDIRKSPDRNRLLRALGSDEEPFKVDVEIVPSQIKGTSFLLCSDGFWEYITDSRMNISNMFSSNSAAWLDKMKKNVEAKGKKYKMDNYSAIAVKCR